MKTILHSTGTKLLQLAGSHRTTAVVPHQLLPIVLQAPSRPGALILGAPSIEEVRQKLFLLGRGDDVFALEPGSFWLSPLKDLERDSYGAAAWVADHAPEPIEDPLARRLLLAGCVLARMSGVGRIESLDEIADAIDTLSDLNRSIGSRRTASDWQEARQSFAAAAAQNVIEPREAETLERFFHVLRMLPSRFLEAVSQLHGALSCWTEGPAAHCLKKNASPGFLIEQIWDAGVVAVADRSLPDSVAGILKESFFRGLATRRRRVFFDGQGTRPIDDRRPAFLCIGFP